MSTSDFQPSVRTVLASFLFVDIVGFSKVPAARQHALKAGLIAVLHRHLAILHIGDFRLRDTGDGALLSFLSNPEHALYMALAVADDLARVAGEGPLALTDLRTGINLGAVKESLDVESRPNYVGDGINAAQRIMDFAQPGQIAASRSFMDAVSQLDAAYEALFTHLGAMADKHGRKHEVFAISPSEPVLRRLRSDIIVARPPQVEVDFDLDRLAPPVVQPPAPPVAPPGSPAGSGAYAPAPLPPVAAGATDATPRRRSVWVLGLVAVVLSAVLGVLIARWFDHAEPDAPGSVPPMAAPASTPAAPAAAVPTTPSSVPASAPVPSASSEPPAASPSPSPAPAPSAVPASAPAPAMAPSAPVNATRPAGSAAVKPAPRKPAEPPTKPAPASAAPAAPAAAAAEGPAVSEQARQRCSRIMQKVSIGEPLTAEEKNNLANSCR